jgi:hypothetical protein
MMIIEEYMMITAQLLMLLPLKRYRCVLDEIRLHLDFR